jgi:hypothetical protein
LQVIRVNLLLRLKNSSLKFREILLAAMLANGMGELSLKQPKEKRPRVYPVTGKVSDLQAPAAHGH